MTEIVFVHGALVRDGAWWWKPVADQVREATGVSSRAVLLPSCGEGPAAGADAGLAEDAAALHAVLDETEAAIVVGHSYGGTVIAEGAEHPAVSHLLYITSYLPEVGQSQASIMSAEPDPVSIAMDGGMLSVDGYTPDTFGERFWADLGDGDARAEAWARVTPQAAAAFSTPTTRASWQGRESTYLVCGADRSTSVALQRTHAARATHSAELPTGHHPFLTRPDLVAQQVGRVLRSL
ncbi:alpha/beta hydrolase [Frondihabitans cladoniiphilus]|uniref:Alpha/beta hydrolase n=1 Tax=Frondihabitans cladoniiphilus TaxID=715785 RepID=A0ABP8VP67_9MICO